jgi:hypothetical protein
MNAPSRPVPTRSRAASRRGQILIVALLVMGVLMILGFAFAGIVGRNIAQAARSGERNLAGDLADAGARFAHGQLVSSELGADWRPQATPPAFDPVTGFSRDPDALYLRQGTGFPLRAAGDPVVDRGGPDGLGPFARIHFDGGRALVRVRYAPSAFDVFQRPAGPLRQPGRARNYLTVEAVGRPGRVDPRDPTTLLPQGAQIANFADAAAFRAALGTLRQQDARNANQRKTIAFASIGIIESARFITNKFRVSRPAELGSLTAGVGAERDGLGVFYRDAQMGAGVPVEIVTQIGGDLRASTGATLGQGAGSIWSNADLTIHGQIDAVVNPGLGDGILVAGQIRPANDNARLNILRVPHTGPPAPVTLSGANLDSRSRNFTTAGGVLRDGSRDTDQGGFSRAVSRKEPPSMLAVDPLTNQNRYQLMTRDSGWIGQRGNSGRFGHGRGVYVDSSERANLLTEDEREQAAAARNLPNEWLNPNAPGNTGWRGPFYVPLAAYLRLAPDGFVITRDSRSRQNRWRDPNGNFTPFSSVRFRLREVVFAGGRRQVYVINSILNPAEIDLAAGQISDQVFVNNGQPFNGVIFFEGDLRVRGVIPTHIQLTVVSMGSIYVEGSITKGITSESGQTVNEPSRSTLMLMARDHVVLNTTQFFAPAPGEDPPVKHAQHLPHVPNALELGETQPSLTLNGQFLLNPDAPGANAFNPQTWPAFASTYVEAGTNQPLAATMLLMHAADAGGPAFLQMDVQPQTFADLAGTGAPRPYLFARSATFNNLAGAFFPGTGPIPIYGLSDPARNAFPRFETIALPLADQTWSLTNRKLAGPSPWGSFEIATQDETHLTLRPTGIGPFAPKNYILARTAVIPHDVRIEAALFAEEGSFFVIPGPPFNFNSEDTRARFDASVEALGLPEAQDERFRLFGKSPEAPFFEEPLNVRVTILGAVSENMPAPIAHQAAWQRRWGWMPRMMGGTNRLLPGQHVPSWQTVTGAGPNFRPYVPNLIIQYDPALALASADGVNPLRVSPDRLWALPPMPRLPVSPTLAYFGEVNP